MQMKLAKFHFKWIWADISGLYSIDLSGKQLHKAFFVAFLQVWSTSTCEFVRTLNGHKRGIACLQYRDRLVVSGSSDNTIRYVGP